MIGRSKILAPLAAVVAVVAVAVTASLVSGGSGGSRSPRVLHLAEAAGIKAAIPARLGAPTSGGGGYRLTGDLPEGKPADAPAWALPDGPGPAEPVARLADAFKAGTPQRAGNGWSAGGLRVTGEAGRAWYFSSCGPDGAVSSEGPVGCAVTGVGTVSSGSGGSTPSSGSGSSSSGASSPEPAPVPKTPTDAAVRAAAAPILEAVGLTVDNGRVNAYPGGGSVTVDPLVDRLKTSSWTTRIDVDAEGKITGAGGWLSAPARADSYPLITAREAFDTLPATPRIMSCAVPPPGSPQGGCLEPPAAEVTGAQLGLTVAQLADGGQLLLPAWLFDVLGSEDPIASVAVEPKYLGTGTDPGTDPGGTPGADPGSKPGTDPNDPASGAPPQVEPATPAPARSPVSFDSSHRATTANAVVVQYGDSGSCPRTNVTHFAKESADSVVVVLEADSTDPGVTCTADYHPVKVEVALQAPLGNRKVIDGSTGREIAVT